MIPETMRFGFILEKISRVAIIPLRKTRKKKEDNP